MQPQLNSMEPSSSFIRKPVVAKDDNIDIHYVKEKESETITESAKTIFLKLPQNFTAPDLTPSLDNNKQKAYQWIASWKQRGWITTIAYGLYAKASGFESQ